MGLPLQREGEGGLRNGLLWQGLAKGQAQGCPFAPRDFTPSLTGRASEVQSGNNARGKD